jgi:hypothetical protein
MAEPQGEAIFLSSIFYFPLSIFDLQPSTYATALPFLALQASFGFFLKVSARRLNFSFMAKSVT